MLSEENKKRFEQLGIVECSSKRNGEDEIILCGKCKAEQPIIIASHTGFVEELDFICCKCGQRNTISSY